MMTKIEKQFESLQKEYSKLPIKTLSAVCTFLETLGLDKKQLQVLFSKGLQMVQHLLHLQPDEEAIIAAFIYPVYAAFNLNQETLEKQIGRNVLKLLRDIKRMQFIESIREKITSFSEKNEQTNNLRKMLLAMIDDVRVVMIKLVEQLVYLESIKKADEKIKKQAAKITQKIYAPLANCLGMGQLKWQLEDFGFRYGQHEQYMKIAKALNMRRKERDAYISMMIQELKKLLKKASIKNATVTGRAKHIFSIYKKLQRKKIDLKELYDTNAFRILIDDVDTCYQILGLINDKWTPIAKEFDDYITHPKPNGYKSIHTAVIGPDGHHIEIQMRTYQMHKEAELGIAAHWAYKEGHEQASSYESKINYLRQVIDWQKQMDADHPNISIQEIFNDRVYVFTPNGDVINLPNGSTPLDFAYHIHTQVGHRCRGAKINHTLVPLTYQLKTGDQVSILLSKAGVPSRDWLNIEAGYLVSPRARAKVQHYFKHQDDTKHLELGTEIWRKFCKRKHLNKSLISKAIDAFAFKTKEQLLMGLGAHDVHAASVYAALRQKNLVEKDSAPIKTEISLTETKPIPIASHVAIEGMDELLIQTAGCCKPIPGDQIVGYITSNRGITIHKQACTNIKHIKVIHSERLIDVNWHPGDEKYYPVDIVVDAQDYEGLLRDITQTIATEKISILKMITHTLSIKNKARVILTLSINNQTMLANVIQKIQHLPKVNNVTRK